MAEDWNIPAPPFHADESLVALQRKLREMKPLAERGKRYDIRGQTVIELAIAGETIEARLARRPARSTEWTRQTLACSLDVRRFVDTVRLRLPLWERDE